MSDHADAALHESVHSCVAVALGRRVRWARVGERPLDGRRDIAEHGAVSIDRGAVIDRRDLIVSLAPGLYEGSPVAFDSGAADFGIWPPMYATLSLDAEGDRGQVSKMVRLLGLTEAEYDDVVRETRELLDDPRMQAWITHVAARLQRTGRITGTDVEACRPSTLINRKGAQMMDTTGNGHRPRIEHKSFATRWIIRSGKADQGTPRSEKAIERPLQVATFSA